MWVSRRGEEKQGQEDGQASQLLVRQTGRIRDRQTKKQTSI
jgi:hypothetical protein